VARRHRGGAGCGQCRGRGQLRRRPKPEGREGRPSSGAFSVALFPKLKQILNSGYQVEGARGEAEEQARARVRLAGLRSLRGGHRREKRETGAVSSLGRAGAVSRRGRAGRVRRSCAPRSRTIIITGRLAAFERAPCKQMRTPRPRCASVFLRAAWRGHRRIPLLTLASHRDMRQGLGDARTSRRPRRRRGRTRGC
jgi:hypothetical protein